MNFHLPLNPNELTPLLSPRLQQAKPSPLHFVQGRLSLPRKEEQGGEAGKSN